MVYSGVFKDIFPHICQLFCHPLCLSDSSFDASHLDFDALVELLAGGRNGLSGAELKVPELVLHSAEPEGKQRTHVFLQKIFPT